MITKDDYLLIVWSVITISILLSPLIIVELYFLRRWLQNLLSPKNTLRWLNTLIQVALTVPIICINILIFYMAFNGIYNYYMFSMLDKEGRVTQGIVIEEPTEIGHGNCQVVYEFIGTEVNNRSEKITQTGTIACYEASLNQPIAIKYVPIRPQISDTVWRIEGQTEGTFGYLYFIIGVLVLILVGIWSYLVMV